MEDEDEIDALQGSRVKSAQDSIKDQVGDFTPQGMF